METYQEVDEKEKNKEVLEVLETKLKEYQEELNKANQLVVEYSTIKANLQGAIMSTQELIDGFR